MTVIATILIYFALLMIISHFTSRNSKTNAAFFKGENKSPWYIVSFGMIGASISGVTFVSVPGMVGTFDMTYMQMVIGFFFGYLIVAHLLLPLYDRLGLTSIYTYLGKRLGNRSYKTGSLFFLLSRMLGTAAKLYLVCLILYTYIFQELHIPFWLIAVGTLVLVWLYTHQSGIKTIVWTDALQTLCLVLALILILVFVMKHLDLGLIEVVDTLKNHEHSRLFVFNDFNSSQNFYKQFFSGIFIVIVMTGLDQDMMQKNLSCRNLKDAQKNMYYYGFSFVPLNFLFLCLGILLLVFASKMQIVLPPLGDDILPLFATQGYLGSSVEIFFALGVIAAAFSNSDSALTSMTTSFCIDILEVEKLEKSQAIKKRHQVHLFFSILLVAFIILFKEINNKSVIDAIYKIASYTYGPLLGMFSFGLLTKRKVFDSWVPYIAILSPIFCFFIEYMVENHTNYKFGYELLMLNGLITFIGLCFFSKKSDERI